VIRLPMQLVHLTDLWFNTLLVTSLLWSENVYVLWQDIPFVKTNTWAKQLTISAECGMQN
jgi:hypothetical protein